MRTQLSFLAQPKLKNSDSITLPPKFYPKYNYCEFHKEYLTFLLIGFYMLLKFWMDLFISRICKP